MDNLVTNFIDIKRIDSTQKLLFLVFLYEHPTLKGTCQEFGTRSYLGDTPILEKIIADLQKVGLVDQVEHGYKLNNEPQVKSCLKRLVEVFHDPVSRQHILDRIKQKQPPLLTLSS